MKNTIAIALAFLIGISAFGQSSPPAVIDKLHSDKSQNYLTKVSQIPSSVVEIMKTTLHSDPLKMADKGGKWNVTDVVTDPDLPFRRLIWAVEVQNHFVIHYEHGGLGYSTHFLVISPTDQNGKRKLEWSAVSLQRTRADLEKFLAMAKSKQLNENLLP